MLVTFEEAGAVRYSISGSGGDADMGRVFCGILCIPGTPKTSDMLSTASNPSTADIVFHRQSALQQRQEEVPVLEAAAHRLVVAAAALPRDTANHACGRAAIMRHERGGIATSRLDH